MTMLGHSLPGGTSCPDFPPCALWGLLVQLCQVSTPVFPVWAASPAPWGYPVIVAQCLGSVSARLPPVPWVLSRSPGRAWELRDVGKVDKGSQVLRVAGPSSVSKTLDAWVLATSEQVHGGLSDLTQRWLSE